jgi:hypothetical protein
MVAMPQWIWQQQVEDILISQVLDDMKGIMIYLHASPEFEWMISDSFTAKI